MIININYSIININIELFLKLPLFEKIFLLKPHINYIFQYSYVSIYDTQNYSN